MRPLLLFIHLRSNSFVRDDLDILGETYEILEFEFGDPRTAGFISFVVRLFRQFAWLSRRMSRADVVFGWFADYHMALPVLLARLFRKPVAVVVGGFDAVGLASLGHGISLSRWRRPLARMVLRRADALLPVSGSLVHSTNHYSEWPEQSEHGIRTLMPGSEKRAHVLPTGYDPNAWPPGPAERPDVVLTAGIIDSDRRIGIKGIDLFMEAARILPDVRFRVVGVVDPVGVASRYRVPPNVELLEPVSRADLVRHYQEASVYAQLSRAEGLPNVLCEAMLCGCIPVGSNVFGIPEGIGGTGFLVDAPDPALIAEAIRQALAADSARRGAARRHVEERFHIDRRREGLTRILSGLRTRSTRVDRPGSGRPSG